MEEKFNKLDNFLRRHLNDASENQNWNVPDDAIFEKAMRTIADGKKKKRRGLIILPFLLAAALLVGEYIVHTREVKMLQGKITTLEDNLQREIAEDAEALTHTTNQQPGIADPQATSSGLSQEKLSPASSGDHISSNQNASAPSQARTSGNPTISSSDPIPNLKAGGHDALKTKTQTTGKNKTSSADQVNTTAGHHSSTTNATPSPASLNATKVETSIPTAHDATSSGTTYAEETANENLTLPVPTNTWVTNPVASLDANGVIHEETPILIILPDPVILNQTKSSPVYVAQAGLLLGGNQSWLTMRNIPPAGNTYLYDYENHQPGFSMNAFVNKPFSPKFSWQAGLGYNIYHNKSVLEDQFLLDMDNVIEMPNGEYMYQTDYNLVNPIGEYSMLLEFRMSGNMQENDTVVETASIEQTFQSVMLDLGIHYDLLTLGDFKVSLGTGLGLGYRAGIKNAFNCSTYHHGVLQKNEMETSDYLYSVNRWYGQWLGNVQLGYYPTRRLGIILVTQYNAGLSSIRDGGSANGPLTFLHSFSLSAGVTQSL